MALREAKKRRIVLKMNIEEIKSRVSANQYFYTHHADIERVTDELNFAQIEEALLNGEILEEYPDSGRG